MLIRRQSVALGVALVVAVALVVTVKAGTLTVGGVTLTYPSYPLTGPALQSCEPWAEPTADKITLTDIPLGSHVMLMFAWSSPYGGYPTFLPQISFRNVQVGTLQVPVQYPMDTTQWPVWNQTTNERAIAVAVAINVFKPDGTVAKLNAKWWVRCLPPPPPAQGCTPGYWRQEQHFDSWTPTGYAPGDDFETVFGVNASFDPHTLLDAVWLGGGGEFALARHAVAALLNAASPDVSFALSVGEVIAGVQAAYASGDFEPFKDQLDAANNAGCSLN